MKNYYLSFGQKNHRKNGWFRVKARTMKMAQGYAKHFLGDNWSMIHSEEEFQPDFFPDSELGRIDQYALVDKYPDDEAKVAVTLKDGFKVRFFEEGLFYKEYVRRTVEIKKLEEE